MPAEAAVSVAGLTKAYGSHLVLDGLGFTVPVGSVFALLGPNGSGKTTTVRILSTLGPADAGTATVLGHDVHRDAEAVRSVIGVTGQFSAVDPLLTGTENLRLMADLYHLPRAERQRRTARLVEQFDLAASMGEPAATLSGGLLRRLDLAMTLVGDPRVLFLDEPTTGLDPRSRREVWQAVRDLVARGVTVVLTTQYLEEADALADHVALLDGGKLVAEGTPAQLKQRVPGGHLRVDFTSEEAARAAEAAHDGATREGDTVRIPVDGGLGSTRALLAGLDERDVQSFGLHTPDLDDVFLALTGHPAEAGDQQKELAS